MKHDEEPSVPEEPADEEQIAAIALSGVLTSEMLRAADGDGHCHMRRTWLYGWEREGLRWLVRFQDRRTDGRMDSAWMPAFLELNREAILSDGGAMNFNLRAARLAKEAAAEKEITP